MGDGLIGRRISPGRTAAPAVGTELPVYKPITDQPRGFDLLRLPGVRRFIRWRYARLVFQVPLLLLALFVIVDGFTGRQLAPRNVATTSVWLHYRGLVVIALALVGNAFCASCPLMLTRGFSRRLERLLPSKLAWPRVLKNKYLVLLLLLLFFYSYEAFDLWASPWLTAWLALGYFGAALAVDTLFPAGTFCRWVCPLGNFNFALSSVSPAQITAVDHDLCRQCEHKPCLHGRESYADPAQASGEFAFVPLADVVHVNGSGRFPGCETDLFAPTVQSNMDCTNCFNCVRACPYDNVALTLRSPAREVTRAPLTRRGGLAVSLVGVLLAFFGLLNAAAMVAPFHGAANWIAGLLSVESEQTLLALLFLIVAAVGAAVTTGTALLADLAGGGRAEPVRALERWGYVPAVLAFGFWASHYLFHFLTGALSIVPVFEHFFAFRGLPVDPNWRLAQLVPTRYLFTITAAVTSAYTLLALFVAGRIALRDFGRRGVVAMWPILLYTLAFAALGLWLLAQPMEMRGTILGPSL
ncbi:MAG TPA: hypothetical protein VF168_04915 [Trueperaceae bacterium]